MKDPGGGKRKVGRKMGKVAPLGEAAAQIRKGGRALVREVKSFFPEPEELDASSLREALEEMEEKIQGEDMEGALERLEEGLAPILAGPGCSPGRLGRRGLLSPILLVSLLALSLLAAWLLSRV